MKAESGLG